MKNLKIILTVFIIVFAVSPAGIYGQDSTSAKTKKTTDPKNIQHGRLFVDENGDGYNDNAPDHDGDGIPNGLDPDYIKFKRRRGRSNLPYIDLDGDGINDNLQIRGNGSRNGFGINRQKNITPQNPASGNNGKGKGNKNRKGGKK
ncbi:MAG: hypothetical protein PVH88_21960 [Ignavibacteria bacterium]|jgi:hypothetical protein